jgi:hypothetical protein
VSEPFQVSNVFEQSGRLFLKTFLIDDSVNGAKWGIVKDYIPKHIEKFVGRPFILTATRTHPPEFYGAIHEDYNDLQGTINRYLRAQEKYRIGTIRKVEPSSGVISASSPSALVGGGWVAYVEITDPAAIAAFKAGHVPKYVSPTVFRLKHEDPPDATTDYEPLHLAAVDVPAYSIDKAGIRGSCTGDLVSCSKQLAQASLPAAIEDCGFCVKGTLEGFQNQLQVNSSFVNSGINQGSELTENNTNASVPAQQNPVAGDIPKQEQSQQQPQQQTQQPQQTTPPIEPNTTGTGQPFTRVEPRVKEEQKAESETAATTTNKETGTESTNDKSKSANNASEVAELNKTVQSMLEELKELKSYKQNQEKIERSNKDAAKRLKIESAIPENYADSPDERKKAVDMLMHYSNDDQLDYILQTFVAPTVSARSRAQPKSPFKGVRNASASAPPAQTKQLTDYGTASVQQGSTTVPGSALPADIYRIEQICSMSDLVTRYRTADNTGGAF